MNNEGAFPAVRLRRLRRAAWLRRLVAEVKLSVDDLIWPVFVHDKEVSEPVAALPGVMRWSIADLVQQAKEACEFGIAALALFPVVGVEDKSEDAAMAWRDDNFYHRAISAVKQAVPEMGIITDVALDPYTSHGQDGVVRDGVVENDATIALLAKMAVAQAKAGADLVAPSDMMDGRVGVIRAALDHAGYSQVGILAYSAKYASAFYGPFRAAVGSDNALKNTPMKDGKQGYQMQMANGEEALREALLDVQEGADLVMVKPAGMYQDVIYRLASSQAAPVFAYQVSGEYAMLRQAASAGAFEFFPALEEALLGIKRAGARAILTYGAKELAERWCNQSS